MKNEVSYSLAITSTKIHSSTHFCIPLAGDSVNIETVFNTKARCFGFYQPSFENGTFFQFKTEDLINALKSLFNKMLQDKQLAFSVENAIAQKRIHIDYHNDTDGYVYSLYVPIISLCKIKNSKQSVGLITQ